jgi:hypothetical protein
MRYLNHPNLDPNDTNTQSFLNTTDNILGVTGEIALFKNEESELRTLLKASSSLSTDYTISLPPNPGLAGQVLATDGTGTLRFVSPDLGGNRIFVSSKNGNDANDGFNQPVRTIKRAAQIGASFSEPLYEPGQIARNAQDLLRSNKAFIAAEVIGFISYCVTNAVSPFTTNFTYNQATCSRDIGYVIEAVIYDLIFGGNAQSIYAGSSYYSATATLVRSNQIAQSVAAMNYAKYVADTVLNNTALTPTSGGLYDYAPYQQYTVDPQGDPAPTSITQTIDITKSCVTSSITGTIASTATTTTITGIADVSTLCSGMVLTKVSGNGAFGGTTVITNVNYITKVVTIKSTTANTANSIIFTGSTISAINNSFDIITGILAATTINDYLTSNNITRVDPLYIPLPVTIQIATGEYYEDNPIITPDKSTVVGDDLRSVIIRPLNPGKDMFRVRNGMYMAGFTFRDALNTNPLSTEYGKPVSTWGYAIAFDDVNDFTVNRGAYIGLAATKPTVTLSPYIQNCSIISFLGGNGVIANGSLVKSPNVPRIYEEVEAPPVGAIPSQKPSMIANAFTMVSFGGTGWKIINDAYAQLVSCFQLFMLNGVYAESGGYVSITNSATNFGINALRSAGYSPITYDFDKGIIAELGSDNQLQTLTTLGHGRVPVNHYVIKIKNNSLEDITTDYKSVTAVVLSINTATDIINSTFQITSVAHGLQNGSSVQYSNEGNDDITGLTSGDIYYIGYVDADHFKLYYDNSLVRLVPIHTATGTHKLTQNVEEFYVNEITNYHNTYQTLTLASNSHTFTPGKQIYGTVSGNITAAYVYSWDPVTSKLVVSLSDVSSGGNLAKVPFTSGSSINSDSGVSISVSVSDVETMSDMYTATYTVKSTIGDNALVNTTQLQSKYIWLNKPSIVNSSSHTWEYAGSGIDYNALPDNGGKSITALQQVAELPGRVYTSGTNELGDFTVGNFITAYNRTGNIIFSNKVTVSELTALKLSLSDITIESISTDVGLGDNEQGGASNKRLTTQLAQRSFLANRLGDFIDKHISTSAIPAAIVQLNGNGQINADLIPPIRGFSTHLINTYGGRLSLYEKIPVEEILAGDVVSETYYETAITTSGNISITAGSVITQATTNASGTVKATVASSNLVVLVLISGSFDTNSGHTLTNTTTSTSLGVYISNIAAPNTNSDSYYLTTDKTSQALRLLTTSNYRFTIGNTVSAAVNGAVATITDYRAGYVTGLGTLVGGSGYVQGTYYNVALTGGTGKYTSAAGATSSGTEITVSSTTGIEIGMTVTVIAGTGAFAAGTVVTNISNIHIELSQAPTTPLSGGAVVRGDAYGAFADISVNSSGIVTSVNLYRGGSGYQVGDVLSAALSNTVPFTATVSSIEKRLYVDITNNFLFSASNISYNYIEDNFTNAFSITLEDSVTKSFNASSTGAGGDVDYVTNRITIPSHGLLDGDPLSYSAGINLHIGNFVEGDTYYAGVVDTDTFELYVDYSLMLKKTFGTSSTGTHTLIRNVIDIHSNHLVKENHGLLPGDSIKISDFDNTAPTAVIDGLTTSVPENSYWFVGSVSVNSFTLHQYRVDALSSVNGATNNEVNFVTAGIGTAIFTVQNVTVTSVINTSSKVAANYSTLSNTTIDASGIISGTVNTTRLGSGTASSISYLRGDSIWHTVTESISKGPSSPITISGNYTTGTISVPGLVGTISSTSTVTTITGLSSTAQLFNGMILTKTGGAGGFGGTATITSIDNSTQISIQTDSANTASSITFTASSSVNQYYGNTTLDIVRADKTFTGTGTYTNTGIAAYDTTYFEVGPNALTGTVSGQVTIKQNVIDAATVNSRNSTYLLTPSNLLANVPVSRGGTNLNAYSPGDILYATGTEVLGKLNVGTSGQVLSSTGTLPIWVGYTGSSSSNVVYSENPTITLGLTAGSINFDLVNTTATTLNFAGASTTLNIGYLGSNASTTNVSTGAVKASTTKTVNIGTGSAASSTTNINIGSSNGGTTTIGSPTITGSGTTTFNMNGANPSIVTSDTGTASVFNTNALTGNLFGAATTIGIGAATGTITLGNPTLTGTTLATFNMNGASPSIVTSSTGTASVFNTNALIGNLFGVATTVTIGATTGTLNLRNVTITAANATSFNMNGASPSITTTSTGIASVFNANALTGNLFGQSTTANIGYTGSATTTSFTQNYSTGYIGSSATSAINIGTGYIGSGSTHTINVGTGGVSAGATTTVNVGANAGYTGSGSTNVNIGSDIGGTTTIKSSIVVGYLGSQALYNSTATTMNFAGAATSLNIGASTGTFTVNNITISHPNATSMTMNGANPSITTSSTGTASVFNTNALTGSLFGAATSIGIGAATGTITLGNPTLTGTTLATFNMNGANPSIVTSSTGTASVFNTNALIGNLFNAATTATLGYTSTAASTTNISTGAVAASTTKTINIGTGGAASSTTTINIGASSGTGTTTLYNSVSIPTTGSSLTFGNTVSVSPTATTSITTVATAVDTWAYATYRSAKYVVQVTCTASTGGNVNQYQTSEVMVIHDGTTATMTEYGVVKTGADLATLTVDINGANCRLLAVAANSTDTITVKLYRTLITI